MRVAGAVHARTAPEASLSRLLRERLDPGTGTAGERSAFEDRFRNEGSAVRVAPLLIIGAVCLGFIGCTASGKKAATQPNPPPPAPAPTFGAPPPQPAQSLPPNTNPVAPASMSGLLAGEVIDD